jgi:hypothetical protein
VASSGAPYTDSSSIQNYHSQLDYFQLEDLPSAVDQPETVPPLAIQAHTYRQPASQPSSPVRGVFAQNQSSFGNIGRARGATFSGSAQGFDFTPYQQYPIASAVPPHLSFSAIPSPINSPLAASPLISASSGQEFFGAVNGADVEDVATPTAQQPPVVTLQQQSQHQPEPIEMPIELVDKLTLLDK